MLQAERGTKRRGTGVHRRFNLDEMFVACTLVGPARLQAPIGILLDISRRIRGNISILRPYFMEAMHKNAPHILAIRFFDVSEDGFGSTCEIWDSSAGKIDAGEQVILIPLAGAFDSLKKFL